MEAHIISDIHLDIWINFSSLSPQEIAERTLEDGELLLVAGDIGHDNQQNLAFLQEAKRRYRRVIAVIGNHDLYVPDPSAPAASAARAQRLKEGAELIGVDLRTGFELVAEPIVVESEGRQIVIVASPAWYDLKKCERDGWSVVQCQKIWHATMNDAKRIRIDERPFIHPKQMAFMNQSLDFGVQKAIKKYGRIDVMLTHVPPIEIPYRGCGSVTNHFYHFDGAPYYHLVKTFVFGHVHKEVDQGGCPRFVANPIGYPGEAGQGLKKVKTIEI
jgi:predicted phosphodiesterase